MEPSRPATVGEEVAGQHGDSKSLLGCDGLEP